MLRNSYIKKCVISIRGEWRRTTCGNHMGEYIHRVFVEVENCP